MVGSAQSIADCNVMLNTIAAEELCEFADRLEKSEDFESALNDLIRETVLAHRRIIFNGNNYADAWIEEAHERGLLNLKTTVDALPYLIKEKNITLFTKNKIFTETELRSRYEVLLEKYCKTLGIEALTMSAKTISTTIVDECNRLYEGEPGDDTTVACVKIKKRNPVNLMIGPPANPADVPMMMNLFFSKEGSKIVCGGTTSNLAAQFLGKPIRTSLDYCDPEIPPIAYVDGIDLVTEGVITISRVVEYAKSYLSSNDTSAPWANRKDGAALVAQMLFEKATDINFFVGKAINPAHQNPDLPINFGIKIQLIQELTEHLKKMGKNIKVSYF